MRVIIAVVLIPAALLPAMAVDCSSLFTAKPTLAVCISIKGEPEGVSTVLGLRLLLIVKEELKVTDKTFRREILIKRAVLRVAAILLTFASCISPSVSEERTLENMHLFSDNN